MKLAPLGGLGEIGLNAMALEHGASRILIDCGLSFPRGAMPGVDVLLPDFSHLLAAPERLQAVVLTHAHEDHVGALPVLLRDLPNDVPVYGTPFTLAAARHRLEEVGLHPELRAVHPGERFEVGGFTLEPLTVTHSVPQATGYAIEAGGLRVVHTGDFKLDEAPIDGHHTAVERLGELGEQGVDLLLSDSTNAAVEGHTRSETVVELAFARLLEEAKGRVVVAMFGSHVLRVRHLVATAARLGRRVCILGRSLDRNVSTARELGLMPVPDGVLVDPEACARLPPERSLIVCTGAQAEERSALSNLLSTEPRDLFITPNDTVVLSSRTIPGNEPQVMQLIDRLYARGAKVVWTGNDPDVHVSGHGARGDLRRMMELVRPKAFTPIHGELHHLHRHLDLAREVGIAASGLVLATDGDVISLTRDGAGLDGRVPVGQLLAQRDGFRLTTPEAVQERRAIAEGGLVVVAVALEAKTGALLGGPTLVGRGLTDGERHVLSHCAAEVKAAYLQVPSLSRLDTVLSNEVLTQATRSALKARLGRRVMVVPALVRA